METFLVKALQLILSLSILVLVHEFGHFIFARIFKVNWRNSIFSLTRGFRFLNSNLKIVIRNTVSAGFLWVVIARFPV